MNRDIAELEAETESVGRIYTEEFQQDPEIFKKKINDKINAIMDKYGYAFALTEFSWIGGQVQANIDIVEKPKE